ncbi:protein sypD [Vibrio ishigakensis]|uniref:Protein sypD n=1 Tax=Vibrio ishigakensis TaxID=1481914 RepID=A0A0B8Q6N6_9VIBR|nr:protein sypD [Vibrio ishigakensis]
MTRSEQIFIQLEINSSRCVCLSSVSAHSGVTEMAMALTERYMLAGFRTLLVDLNLDNPAFESIHFNNQGGKLLISHKESHRLFSGMPAPSSRADKLMLQDPETFKQSMAYWLDEYDRVVIDAGAIDNGHISTSMLSSLCCNTVLMTNGGENTNEEVDQAIEALANANANLLAIILNQHQESLIGSQWLKTISSFKFLPKVIKRKLETRISSLSFCAESV